MASGFISYHQGLETCLVFLRQWGKSCTELCWLQKMEKERKTSYSCLVSPTRCSFCVPWVAGRALEWPSRHGCFCQFSSLCPHRPQPPKSDLLRKCSLPSTELSVSVPAKTSSLMFVQRSGSLSGGRGSKISVLHMVDMCRMVTHFYIIHCALISSLQEPSKLILCFLAKLNLSLSATTAHRIASPVFTVDNCKYQSQVEIDVGRNCSFYGFPLCHFDLDDIIKRHRKEQTDAKAAGDRRRQQIKNRNSAYGFGRPRFRAWMQRNLQGTWVPWASKAALPPWKTCFCDKIQLLNLSPIEFLYAYNTYLGTEQLFSWQQWNIRALSEDKFIHFYPTLSWITNSKWLNIYSLFPFGFAYFNYASS